MSETTQARSPGKASKKRKGRVFLRVLAGVGLLLLVLVVLSCSVQELVHARIVSDRTF